jgi:hypothetical protein
LPPAAFAGCYYVILQQIAGRWPRLCAWIERIRKFDLQADVAFLLTGRDRQVRLPGSQHDFLARDFQEDCDALPSADAG